MAQIYKLGDMSKRQLIRELEEAKRNLTGVTFFYRLMGCTLRRKDPNNWIFSVLPKAEFEALDNFIASGEYHKNKEAILKNKEEKVDENAKN